MKAVSWTHSGTRYCDIVQGDRLVATVPCGSDHPATVDRARATADLISAAPDMRDALENLLNIALSRVRKADASEEALRAAMEPAWIKAIGAAQEALRKARAGVQS